MKYNMILSLSLQLRRVNTRGSSTHQQSYQGQRRSFSLPNAMSPMKMKSTLTLIVVMVLISTRTVVAFRAIPIGSAMRTSLQESYWTKTVATHNPYVVPQIWSTSSLQRPPASRSTQRIGMKAHIQHNLSEEIYDNQCNCDTKCDLDQDRTTTKKHIGNVGKKFLLRLRNRLDVIHTTQKLLSGNNDNNVDSQRSIILTSGIGRGLFGTIKKLHDPITYFIMGILFGFRYDWCFRSPIYWFAIGFTIKWYRARYVFKIPVWDRQPNWNNIITSKEQEKDLKAYTCKNCGSTIFIAKTREFFFEGNTGIGGLGCFSCGARGKDNFVMDRDRIVEDVGDMDDYFEYERPLDFVSRAERRKLLKETQGDEEKANQLLLERTTGITSTSSTTSNDSTLATIDAVIEDDDDDAPIGSITIEDETPSDPESLEIPQSLDNETLSSVGEVGIESKLDHDSVSLPNESPMNGEAMSETKHDLDHDSSTMKESTTSSTAKSPTKTMKPSSTKPKVKRTSSLGLDGLDELDMDAW